MKKFLKRFLLVALILLGLFLLACVGYLIYLLVTVVIPMVPGLIYAMLK